MITPLSQRQTEKKAIICPIEQQYSKKTKREMGKSIQEWNE